MQAHFTLILRSKKKKQKTPKNPHGFHCLLILHPTAKITESLNDSSWKGPLEVTLSNVPAQEGHIVKVVQDHVQI